MPKPLSRGSDWSWIRLRGAEQCPSCEAGKGNYRAGGPSTKRALNYKTTSVRRPKHRWAPFSSNKGSQTARSGTGLESNQSVLEQRVKVFPALRRFVGSGAHAARKLPQRERG